MPTSESLKNMEFLEFAKKRKMLDGPTIRVLCTRFRVVLPPFCIEIHTLWYNENSGIV